MKADIPLAERRRIERDQWAEIRAALVRRHFDEMQEEQAIAYYWVAHAFEAAPAIRAVLAHTGHGPVPVPSPVVTAEPEPVSVAPMPAPVPVRAGAPDLPFDMRERLGLR